jgi:hypothetical protein
MLTDLQKQFILVSKQIESLKDQLKELNEKSAEMMKEIGLGTSFQDPTDNTVFLIVEPNGTFIEFKKIGYERTRREGERSGSLSLTKAKELGYQI